jgi:D-sedoheptulose 7-phosphate isomerase
MRSSKKALAVSKLQRRHVDAFVGYYGQQLRECLDEINVGCVAKAAATLRDAVRQGHRIFAFGNGGSLAIATNFLNDLAATVAPERRLQIVHYPRLEDLVQITRKAGFDGTYARTLESLARKGDWVLLVSASGRSANILRAANRARQNSIKTVCMTNHATELSRKGDISVLVPTEDQQIGEDCLLVLVKILARTCGPVRISGSAESAISALRDNVRGIAQQLNTFLQRLDTDWLLAAAREIAAKYHSGGRVFIFAPLGGGQLITAQHLAHNLKWDALYGANGIQSCSGILLSDFSDRIHYTGVCNDRSGDLLIPRQIYAEANAGDTVLILGGRIRDRYMKDAIAAAATAKTRCYAVSLGKVPAKNNNLYCLGNLNLLKNDLAFDCALQIICHMLGRVVRVLLCLNRTTASNSREDRIRHLLEEELAELKNKKSGSRALRKWLHSANKSPKSMFENSKKLNSLEDISMLF